MSLTGVLLRHANLNRNREVEGVLQMQGRRTSWAGSVRVIDRDRQRLGMNVVHKAYRGLRRRNDVAQRRD